MAMTTTNLRLRVATHDAPTPTRTTIDLDLRGLTHSSRRRRASTPLAIFFGIVAVTFTFFGGRRLVRPFGERLGRAPGATAAARAGSTDHGTEKVAGGSWRAPFGEKGNAAVGIGVAYSNPAVLEGGCSVTVVFAAPSLSEAGLWSLESAAANIRPAGTACFLLQLSVCRLEREGNMTEAQAAATLGESLLSLLDDKPFFRSHVERGSVRLSVVNYTKYGLRSCDNFKGISSMWLDLRYWGTDEFIAGVDSDLVLVIQADAVLCHPLDVDQWRPFAFVGAPWLPKGYHLYYFAKQWDRWHEYAARALGHNSTLPPYPSKVQLWSDPNQALVGNGGLSLRSRGWVQRALAYCPNEILAGDDLNLRGAMCRQDEIDNEDMVIGVILRGMAFNNFTGGAEGPVRLPSASEAAMFAGESALPEQVKEYYKLTDEEDFDRVADRLWWTPSGTEDGEGGLDRYRRMRSEGDTEDERNMIVPIGLHKPWPYLKKYLKKKAHVLVGETMEKECPYFKHIIPRSHKEQGLYELAEIKKQSEEQAK